MYFARSNWLSATVLIVSMSAGLAWVPAHGDEQANAALEQRILELIDIFNDRDANGKNLEQTRRAINELAKVGLPAVPHLVRAIVNNKEGSSIAAYSANALDKIGKPAVETVRRMWEPMFDDKRWRLMRFRGKFDYSAALPFAQESLESNDERVRRQAIEYLGEHREDRARAKLLKMLDAEAPRLRWRVISALKQIRGKEVIEAFVALLGPNSWTAKGDGLSPPAGDTPWWWPDGRPEVIIALHEMNATESGAAMLDVLREKGPGKGYLAQFIIPALVQFKCIDAIPELRLIASANVSEVLGYASGKSRVQSEARKAIQALERRNE